MTNTFENKNYKEEVSQFTTDEKIKKTEDDIKAVEQKIESTRSFIVAMEALPSKTEGTIKNLALENEALNQLVFKLKNLEFVLTEYTEELKNEKNRVSTDSETQLDNKNNTQTPGVITIGHNGFDNFEGKDKQRLSEFKKIA